MEYDPDRIVAITPFNHDWNEHGNWRSTLQTELSSLPPGVQHMYVKSTSSVLFRTHPFLFGIHMQGQGGQWRPFEWEKGYEYCFKSTDGRGLDEINIQGPFNKEALFRIAEAFATAGLEFKDRWSLVILFLK